MPTRFQHPDKELGDGLGWAKSAMIDDSTPQPCQRKGDLAISERSRYAGQVHDKG